MTADDRTNPESLHLVHQATLNDVAAGLAGSRFRYTGGVNTFTNTLMACCRSSRR